MLLGDSLSGLFAYYLASPFNLILMLFPILFFTVFNIVFGVYSGPVLAVLTAIGEGRL